MLIKCSQIDYGEGGDLMNGRLRELRLSKGLTQESLAQKAGIHKSTVYRIEDGKTQPSPTTMTKLSRALETTPERLTAELREPTSQ